MARGAVTGALVGMLALAGASGSAERVAAPLCSPSQVGLSLRVEGVAGGLVPAVGIRNTGGAACHVRSVTLVIARPGSAARPLASIDGNPAAA